MPQSFLVVGATGNTGGAVLRHLADTLASIDQFSKHRIIGLTRNKNSNVSKELAKLPRVEMIEQDWTMIKPDWLRQHDVKRIFIASHNNPTHFTDESLFLTYALEVKIDYVVRISTTTINIDPATPVFYARNHWAIETMLESHEFKALKWTSLQPNVFISMFTGPVKDWVQSYKKDGTKKPYKIMLDGNNPAAPIDAEEVGTIAGKLLAIPDVAPHSGKKYCLNGPQNGSGKKIVELIEKHAGTKVDDVTYRDTSYAEDLKGTGFPENVISSLALAPMRAYEGGTSVEAMPTSPEIVKIHTMKNGLLDVLDTELGKV
jgi:uncharacterized protein YbjT (DUF2867 family)